MPAVRRVYLARVTNYRVGVYGMCCLGGTARPWRLFSANLPIGRTARRS